MTKLQLLFAACTLLMAPALAAMSLTPLPIRDSWQQQDWHTHPQYQNQANQSMLFAHYAARQYQGLAILLPEWQQSAALWPLWQTLTRVGFDTLLLPPSPEQWQWDPASEQKKTNQQTFTKQWGTRLTELIEQKLQPQGRTVILAQGSSAPWLANLIASGQLKQPDGLILLNGSLHNRQSDLTMANDLANLPTPILDLYLEEGSPWPILAAAQRKSQSLRADKQNYRPYALLNEQELPERIQGWLSRQGWH